MEKKVTFSLKRVIFCLFIFWIHHPAVFQAQDSTLQSQEESENELLNKYLSGNGDIDQRIDELRESASIDNGQGRISEAINKLQIALILEEQVKKHSNSTFRLNVFTGDLVSSMDLRYALAFYHKAIAIADSVEEILDADKFYLYTNTAGVYADLGDLVTGLQWFRKALQVALRVEPATVASAYNNLGFFYNKHAQYDSARFYFHKALFALGEQQNNMAMNCAIKDNIAQLNIREGWYEEALNTFRYNDSVYFRTLNLHYKYLPNKVRLLDMMQKLSMPGIPDTIIRLQQFIDRSPFTVRSPDVRDFYRFAQSYFFTTSDRLKQNEYHLRFVHLTDSLFRTKEVQLHALTKSLLQVQESSLKNEIRSHQLEAEQSKFALKAAKRIGIIILIAILSVGVVLIMYFRKRRQQLQDQKKFAEAALRNKEMEARLIQQDLELKKRDLTTIVLHNTQVYDHNQKMIDRLQSIQGREDEMKKQLRSLILEMQSQNMVGDRSIVVQQQINIVNSEFYEKLKNRFPDLTKSESELCGFIRINLSSKDISILKNVEANSVKMGKNRLRKKLGLEAQGDLYSFIQEI